MVSDGRELSDAELWRLLVGEFGGVRLVKMLGWLQFWLWFPGRDLRAVVEEAGSYATSYRVLQDARRMLQVWARAEGREDQYTLHDLAERLEAVRRGGLPSPLAV
jgi:hypothetical protein